MKTKILEIRDSGTFIPVLAIDMNPDNDIQRYYLRRVGYPCDYRPNIAITNLNMGGGPTWNDPYGWVGSRTYSAAHNYILDHWDDLDNGDVVDVQFIMGETENPKVSERLTEKEGINL